jgi:hypothetical protein
MRRCSRISGVIPVAELTAVFEGWIDRVRWVIAHNGQYSSSRMLGNHLKSSIVRPRLCRKDTLIPLESTLNYPHCKVCSWLATPHFRFETDLQQKCEINV